MRLVGVDVGGTFTDLVAFDGARLRAAKVFTTPADPSQGVAEGLRELGIRPPALIVHGSTIATNAFLERKGAKVALYVTRGFRDLLSIGRQARGKLYDLDWSRPRPIVGPRSVVEVDERMGPDGRPIQPIRTGGLKVPPGTESAAVCLLHSYRNPSHERAVGRWLRRRGIPVSLSSDVLPEYREYERLTTTVINAYLSPVVRWYISGLRKMLRGFGFRMMGSQGGSLTARGAVARPVSMILSGPAAGVVAAAELCRRIRDMRAITFDMGGTSTDVSLIDREPRLTREAKLDGIPIRTPMIDTNSVGAGGGSIAWSDSEGALRVGPQSQGAVPGPACYGRGGTIATVTDAHLVLGRLDPSRFFGGRLPLKPQSARQAISNLARALRRPLEAVAEAVVAVANSSMERAIRLISLERGYDVREFSLIAFGGAGPLHACDLARSLGLRRVIVPPNPGNFCALGAIQADVLKELSRTVLLPCVPAAESDLRRGWDAVCRSVERELRAEGVMPARASRSLTADVRYEGQSYELPIPWRGGALQLRKDFEASHEKRFGYRMEDRAVQVVNVGAEFRLRVPKPSFRPARQKEAAPTRSQCRFDGRWRPVAHFERASLPARWKGPVVIHEPNATTFVPPDFEGTADASGNLILEPR